MTYRQFYLKKPQKNLFDKTKDFSQKGRSLSQRNHLNLVVINSSNQIKSTKNNCQPIFNSLSSKILSPANKILKRHLRSTSQIKKGQIKPHLNIKTNQNKQSFLFSIISKDLKKINELRCRTKQNTKNRRNRTSPDIKDDLSKFLNEQIQQQHTRIYNLKKDNQRKGLESTNISIASIPCLNKENVESPNVKINSFNKLFNRNIQKQIRTKLVQSVNAKLYKQRKLLDNKDKLDENCPQDGVQVRLSIKSVSKYLQGQNEQKNNQIFTQTQSNKLYILNKKLVSLQKLKEGKQIFTSRNFKHNRMLIRFDKRFLLNSTQINDSSLRIQRINSLSSRLKTYQNV